MSRRLSPATAPVAWRLGRFTWERFPPLAYAPLILAFVACGWVGAALAAGAAPHINGWAALAAAVVALAFFRLRLVDELKDAAIDQLGRPDRPLPRGLVTAGELRAAAVVCGVVELAGAVLLGPSALLVYAVVLVYSLASANDFFLDSVLHRNLVAYALAHSPLPPLLLAFAWCSYPGAAFGPGLAGLAVLVWGAALTLEVARKTVALAAERPHVETYSAALGLRGAVLLAASTLAVGCVGAAAYAATVAPAAWAIGCPLVGGATWVAAGAIVRNDAGLRMVRAAAAALAVVLLLWPVVVALAAGFGG